MFDKHLENIDSLLDEAVPGCRLSFVIVISTLVTHWFVPIFVSLLDSVRFRGDQLRQSRGVDLRCGRGFHAASPPALSHATRFVVTTIRTTQLAEK